MLFIALALTNYIILVQMCLYYFKTVFKDLKKSFKCHKCDKTCLMRVLYLNRVFLYCVFHFLRVGLEHNRHNGPGITALWSASTFFLSLMERKQAFCWHRSVYVVNTWLKPTWWAEKLRLPQLKQHQPLTAPWNHTLRRPQRRTHITWLIILALPDPSPWTVCASTGHAYEP